MISIHLWKAKMKIHFTSKNNTPFLNGIAILLMLGLVGASSLLITFPAFGHDSLAKADPIRDGFSKFCNLYYTGDTTGKVTTCTNQSIFFSSFLSSLTDKTSLSLWPTKASLSDLASQGKLKNSRGSITTEGAFFNAIPNADVGLRTLFNPHSDQNILSILWKYNSTLDNNSSTIQRIIHGITCPNGTVEVRRGLCVLKELCSVVGRPKCSNSGIGCPSNPLGVGIRLCMLGVVCGLVGKPMCPIQPWSGTSVFYPQGALATYANNLYVAIQAHTSQPSYDPVAAPSLWALMAKG